MSHLNLNLNLIECFLTLAETLSFTETARRLQVTQPSISRQLRLLEDELQTNLFIRNKRSVKLSPAGKELRTKLAPLLDEMKKAFSSAREKTHSIEGALTFACLPEIGQFFFGRLLVEFQKNFPLVDLHIEYLLPQEIIEGIHAGSIDFGVVSLPVISETIRSYKLMEERAVLVTRASNREPLDPDTAAFVGYSKYDALLQGFLKPQHPHSPLARIRRLSTVNSHRTMLDMLASRDCYAVLPHFSVQEGLKKKQLRLASDRELGSMLYLVHLETSTISARSEAFRKFLLAKCKAVKLD